MEQNFENWEEIPSLEDTEKELQQIKKNLTNRNLKTVSISLVMAVVLVLASIYGVLPLVEKCYPDPYWDYVRESLEAYYELTNPGKSLRVSYGKTGFASYDLFLTAENTASGKEETFRGSLDRGKLQLDQPFFDREITEAYLWSGYDHPDEVWEHLREDTIAKFQELPEYVTVEAAAYFPEDLTMKQIMDLEFQYGYGASSLNIQWLAVRCCDPEQENQISTFGFAFQSNGHWDLNERYPEFRITHMKADGSHFEQHFKSLLKFSIDQVEQGVGILYTNSGGSIYQQVLDYVEENGVKSYACLVSGTPSDILSLLEKGVVENLILTDGWIDIGT